MDIKRLLQRMGEIDAQCTPSLYVKGNHALPDVSAGRQQYDDLWDVIIQEIETSCGLSGTEIADALGMKPAV